MEGLILMTGFVLFCLGIIFIAYLFEKYEDENR